MPGRRPRVGLARKLHTRAWSIHTPRRFAPPLSVEGTRSTAGEIPSGAGCPTGRGVSVRIWKCEKPGLSRRRGWRGPFSTGGWRTGGPWLCGNGHSAARIAHRGGTSG